MPGYHAVHGTKCVANSEILNDILRDYLGFDGMVVSDYTAIDQLPGLDTPLQKAVAAINGGNDVDFPRGENYQYLQEALDKGLVKKEVFERAVKDVLRYKIRAGLMDKNPYLYSTEDVKLDTKEERQTAYDIASQSIVLLENNGVLPLVKELMLTAPSRLRISCSRVLMPIPFGRCVATTLSLQCSISGRVGRKSGMIATCHISLNC